MLTHPDPQTQKLFNMLEQQRDDAIIGRVNAEMREEALKAENVSLKAALEAVAIATANPPAPVELIPGIELPRNVVPMADAG